MSQEDEYWERTAHYGGFAQRCGWTLQEVDAQPIWYIARLSGYFAILDELEAERRRARQ